MPTDDDQVRYNEEDKKVVTDYARMAAKYPDTMDDLRAALRTSATLIVSDRPEIVSEFRRLAEEVDSFLRACQTGEVDPHRFLQTMERED